MRARSSKAALGELQRIGALIPSVVAVFADIQEIGSIEAAAESAEKRRDKALSDLAAAATNLDQIRSQTVSAQSALDNSLAEKMAQHDSVIASKNSEAADAIASAKSQAEIIISTANSDAEKIVSDAKTSAAAVTDGIAASKIKLQGVNSDITTAGKKLAALQASISDIENSKRALLEKLG